MFKNFLMKKLIKSKLKGLPDEQVDMIINMVSDNPDFFKKIQNEVEAKKKGGMNEMAAMMQVMREHQGELQKLMQQKGKS